MREYPVIKASPIFAFMKRYNCAVIIRETYLWIKMDRAQRIKI